MARYHNPKITTNKNLSLVLDAANPKSYTGVTTSVTTTIEDPYADNVSLLLNGNGDNGSTTFTDSSSYGHTVTPVGGAQISTAQNKFGGASMYFDGNGDYLSIPDSDQFEIGSGDFTFEAWIYLTGYSVAYQGQYYVAEIICKDSGSTGRGFTFYVLGTSTSWTSLRVGLFSSNSTLLVTSATTSFNLNTWYHVAAVRNGTSLRLYKNGVDVGGGTNATSVQNTTTVVTVGSENPYFISAGNAYYFPGYIDDLRITKGVARYTSNFNPPEAELSLSTTETQQAPVLTDISLNNNTATLYNGVGYTSSNVGYFTFNGTNNYMEIPYDESVNLTDGDFTIDFWMNSFADQTSDVLVSYGNTSNVGGWAIKTATNKLQYSVGFATHPAVAGIVTSGLVLNLDAGNSNSYPGSGTTWNDLSGNGNNGTLTNMDGTNLDSANGGSFTFDGTNEYVELSTITLLRASSTISAWINIDDFTTGKTSKGRVFIKRTGDTFNNLIAFYNGGYSFETNTNGNPHEISGRQNGNISSSAISAGSWFHFSLVFDSNTFYGYVNGVLTGSASLADNLFFDRIGDGSNFSDSYPAYMKGKISNFTVYNRALTASEIQRNYSALKGRYTSPSPLDPLDTFGIAENADFSSGITTNTWNHYALVRSGNVYTPYVNAVPGNPSYDYSADLNRDLYFDNASIILNANGDNGSTNIIDSSKNNHTGIITAYSGAGISTAESKFGGSSLYFDGTDDYIDCGISSDYSFGNDPFTIEFWMRVNTSFFHTSQNTIFSTTRDYGQFNQFIYGGIELEARIGYDTNTGEPKATFIFTQRDNSGSNSPSFNVPDYVSRGAFFHDNWGHIAISCDGTYHRLFFNGVLAPSLLTAYKQPYEGDQIIIGARKLYGTINNFINAYIDDFIITKGVAKYTENFTPPNQASYYSDDPNYDNLSILLQGNGQNLSTSIIDSSPNNHTGIITAYSGAGISTAEYKFGGSSLYFDGTDDYIDCGTDPSYAMEDGDFTIEFWMYTDQANSGNYLFRIGPQTSPDGSLAVYVSSAAGGSGNINFERRRGGLSVIDSASITGGQWNHIAWTKEGDRHSFFSNGTLSYSTTGTDTQSPYNENDLTLGAQYFLISGTRYYDNYNHFNGYIDDFRITKGVAKYTEDFIPPDRTKIQNNRASLKFGASGIGNTNPFNGALSNLKIYKDSLTQSEITQNFNAHKSRYGL